MSRSAGKGAARVAVALWAPVMMWVVLSAIAPAPSFAAPDRRELQAREAFAAGRYQEALDLYAKLYAEKLHPNYLRNIGRCYQNLGDADHAIISFRDYLRKHKTITAEERKEVEGFIAEMEDLKKQHAASATAPETASAPPKAASSSASTITPLPAAPEPKASTGAAPEALVTMPASHPEQSSPVYTRWWFWTLIGAAAVGAGLGIAAATGALTKTQDAGCVKGYTCQ
jgi:tetratricopeptide (TPR) repeat protein